MIRLETERLVVATHNAGKVREIASLLESYGVTAIAAADLGLAEPAETGATFAENAAIKARAATLASRLPALADDSGLEVSALGGSPGIYSARWAGEGKDFQVAMRRVHNELWASGKREPWRARFVCALALAVPDHGCETWEGTVEGRCIWPPRGERGFGYDPMFVPEGDTETFGEMDPARKDAMSHRRRALDRLAAAVFAGSS